MRVKEVKYGMVRETRRNATDMVEITVEVNPGEIEAEALTKARALCDEALAAARDNGTRDRLRVVMGTEEGRRALEAFLDARR